MAETVVEFQVNMTCQNCVKKISAELEGKEGILSYDIDLNSKSVVISSTKPTSDIQSLIESTGKKAVVLGSSGKSAGSFSAVAMLGGSIGCSVNELVKGVIRFTQVDPDNCIIDGTIDGLSPGYHGLAIHESGDLSQGCHSLGGHYNPRNTRHGSPQDEERHVGDLGNVLADEKGRASFKFSDKMIKVGDLIGRSVVIGDNPDDFGRGSNPLSKIDGNIGIKLACGIIARSSGLFQNSKRFCDCDGVSLWDERDKPLAGPGRSAS